MTLSPEVQAHVDAIRMLLGVPACKLVVNIDRDGVVQGIEAGVYYSKTSPAVDRREVTR